MSEYNYLFLLPKKVTEQSINWDIIKSLAEDAHGYVVGGDIEEIDGEIYYGEKEYHRISFTDLKQEILFFIKGQSYLEDDNGIVFQVIRDYFQEYIVYEEEGYGMHSHLDRDKVLKILKEDEDFEKVS